MLLAVLVIAIIAPPCSIGRFHTQDLILIRLGDDPSALMLRAA